MSHLLESYSLQTGAKISKPFIIKNFYPVPDKYITIHNSSGMGAKNYDYFQEVVDEILPILTEHNIKIVQIGIQEDPPLQGCIHLHGKTSYHQTAYIIENALLHVGNDSFPIHLASAANKPIVGLYSITLPSIAGPVFNTEDVFNTKVFCFTPDYNGKKPSFNPNESPKTVNSIGFENIIQAIFKILEIKDIRKIKTIHIGEKFKNKILELIPDTLVKEDFLKDAPMIMRVDLLDKVDENLIFANLKIRKFYVHISNSKKIQHINILQALKAHIIEIVIDVTSEPIDTEYVLKLTDAGFKPIIMYQGNDQEYFDKIKINLLDLNLRYLHEKNDDKKIDEISKKIENAGIDNVIVKTNKVLLSKGKVFITKEHMIKDIFTNYQIQKLNSKLELKNMLKEKDALFIYSITQ